jgi:hypothetical protein
MHINTIKVYITTVSLCYSYSYMFRHFRVIIREFITNILLNTHVRQIAAVGNTVYRVKIFCLNLI